MDTLLLSPLPSISTIAIFFLTIFISSQILKRTKENRKYKNLPPIPFRLPIVGNMHNLIGLLPHRTLDKLSKKYGPVMRLQLGELPLVIISSPEAAKELLKTHDLNFANRPSFLVAEIMNYGCSIAASPYGNWWRQLRKLFTLELVSAKRVRSFRYIREEVYSDLVRWLSEREGSVINLSEKLYASTHGIVSRAALGKDNKEKKKLLDIIDKALQLGAGFDITEMFPSIPLLRLVSTRPKLEKLHNEADEILEGIIREHKEERAKNEVEENKHEDLIDVLLRLQEEGLEFSFSHTNAKALILEALGAGSDTSATTMDWAMSELIKNPNVLKRATEELRSFFDTKGYVDESQLHELKYFNCVVKEVLRLHSSLLAPRKCEEDCEIAGYTIPADSKVVVNAWAINRDPRYWPEPDVFRPERFLDSSIDYKGNNFEFIPFGAGRRMCPGMSFGMANVELPLATFLYHFDWKLPNGMKNEDLDMAEKFSLTAGRKTDLLLVPIVKRPLPVK